MTVILVKLSPCKCGASMFPKDASVLGTQYEVDIATKRPMMGICPGCGAHLVVQMANGYKIGHPEYPGVVPVDLCSFETADVLSFPA